MTEKEKLEQYIGRGFIPFMCVRNISAQEKLQRDFPKEFTDREMFALPLSHPDGETIMFYFVEEDTLHYAKRLAEKQAEIIGYHLCCHCAATSSEAPRKHLLDFNNIVTSLKDLKGWDARVSANGPDFEIHFEIAGPDETKAQEYINEVDSLLLALSLRNSIGFAISDHSLMPKYRGQPFSITVGRETFRPKGITKEDVAQQKAIRESEEALLVAETLRVIYSQTDIRSRIIVGWAAVDELLDSAAQHMLTREETREILQLAETVESIKNDKEKCSKLRSVLKDANLMAKENRTTRIAKAVASLIGCDFEEAVQRIRDITHTRGRLAHRSFARNIGDEEDIKFIEQILKRYMRDNIACMD